MSNWVPGAFGIGIILLLGFLFPLITEGFVDKESIQPTGLMNDTIDFFDNGYNFTINLPILPDVDGTLPSPVPSSMREPLVERLTYMSLIPNTILIPLLILSLLGIIWSIVKFVLP